MSQRSHIGVLGMIVGLTVAACGGSSDDSAESAATTSPSTTAAASAPTTSQTDSTTGTTQAFSAEGTGAAGSESIATVVIDGVEYTFFEDGLVAGCDPDFFGGFTALLYTEDLSHQFSVTLWKDGAGDGQQVTQAFMNIEVDGEILDLEANPESSWPAAEAGSSFVDPFTYEGSHAFGTAHFINSEVAYNADLAPLAPIVAEFDIVCVDG